MLFFYDNVHNCRHVINSFIFPSLRNSQRLTLARLLLIDHVEQEKTLKKRNLSSYRWRRKQNRQTHHHIWTYIILSDTVCFTEKEKIKSDRLLVYRHGLCSLLTLSKYTNIRSIMPLRHIHFDDRHLSVQHDREIFNQTFVFFFLFYF